MTKLIRKCWRKAVTAVAHKASVGRSARRRSARSSTASTPTATKLAIVNHARNVEYRGDGVLEFETLGGHAYEVDVISEPSAPPYIFRRTVYLKPKETDGPQRFYRVRTR